MARGIVSAPPLFQPVRKIVNPQALCQTNAWILLQRKSNRVGEELRVIETRRAKRDMRISKRQGWTTEVSVFVTENERILLIKDTLESKLNIKVRGLFSKAALAEAIAQLRNYEIFNVFACALKDPQADGLLRRVCPK